MNIIISLIHLQASEINDAKTTKVLDVTKNRVRSMMVLYDKLYMTGNTNVLSVKTYLSTLIDEIILNLPDLGKVKIEKEIDDFNMDIKRLSPIGIILNELLTNSMKYAFKNTENGELSISILNNNNHVVLILSDNGIGFPENINIENTPGLGLKLISSLAEQIDGVFRIEHTKGSKCILEFNL